MNTAEIRTSLQAVLKFLSPYCDFVNSHMVNYLTDNHWEKFIPRNLRENIESIQDVTKCIDEVFWKSEESAQFVDVWKFFQDTKRKRLEEMKLTSVRELQSTLGRDTIESTLTIKEFMSEKKRHEVEITAKLVNDLVQEYLKSGDLYIVDAGDGKGYLSSRLALQYELQVLGIDSNQCNTENALQRSKKLQRAWNALTERAELQRQGITPPRRGKKPKSSNPPQKYSENYKTISRFITTQLDFVAVIKELFIVPSAQCPQFCLTGLHTCGNLAPTCLKVFTSQPNFRILCNIGCCYHLLKEEFSPDEFYGNKEIMDKQSEIGFPMSECLRGQHVRLGRNARMLAAQSIHRTQSLRELPNKSLFYRALLEVLIVERKPELKNTVQVGKIKKFNDFKQYVGLCSKKANLGLENLTDEYLQQVESKYSDQKHFLDLFYLVRMTFAPVLETLILLDRLLYLRENGFEHSYLIPLFDPVISPRRFCIVAMK